MKVDQCLFGYDDGHRLLATSFRIDGKALSDLTLFSDAAPGVRFGGSEGYWTGVPVPEIRRYALMYTWPAPEMPRPGCVWTHALLLPTALFDTAADIAELIPRFRRPEANKLAGYERSIDLGDLTREQRGASQPFYRRSQAAEIYLSIYENGPDSVGIHYAGEVDDLVFRIWSQQWPRLRRNFRFQTSAALQTAGDMGGFDFRLIMADRADAKDLYEDGNEADWLSAAIDDLDAPGENHLRQFLWRYGSDVRRQKASFQPLCELALASQRDSEGRLHETICALVLAAFPHPDDARRLKQDLVDGEIFPLHQLDTLHFLIQHGDREALPAPTAAGIDRLSEAWTARGDDIVRLGEEALFVDHPLAITVLGIIAAKLAPPDFWRWTGDHPTLRRTMVEQRPELLDTPDIMMLDASIVIEAIALLERDPDLRERVIKRLIDRDSQPISSAVFAAYPQEACHCVVEMMDRLPSLRGKLASSWLKALSQHLVETLRPEIFAAISKTSTLYRLADLYGWDNGALIKAGTAPWVAALVDIDNDLIEEDALVLLSFYIFLAFVHGGGDAERLLEIAFAPVHRRILKSGLPWRAKDLLLSILPEAPFGKGWDVGLRLRRGVAGAYVHHKLHPKSYAALADDRKTRRMLADAAEEYIGGSAYARAVS